MEQIQVISAGCHALEVVYKFLQHCINYSHDAESLANQLKWDVRLLSHIHTQLQDMAAPDNSQSQGLSSADLDYISEVLTYLQPVLRKSTAMASKIEAKNWRYELGRFSWAFMKKDCFDLQREVFDWCHRFDARLMILPTRVTSVMNFEDQPTAATATQTVEQQPQSPAVPSTIDPDSPRSQEPAHHTSVLTQRRVRRYLALTPEERILRAKSLLIEQSTAPISTQSSAGRWAFAIINQKQVVVEHIPHDLSLLLESQKPNFEKRQTGLLSLCAELNNVDPFTTGLLRCVGLQHDSTDPTNPGFGIVYSIPFQIEGKPRSLRSLLEATYKINGKDVRLPPQHSLDQRFELARKLATGLLSLHSIGWIHKNITSANILVLENRKQPPKLKFPKSLGHPYLMALQYAREDAAISDMTDHLYESSWAANLYRHPNRHVGGGEPLTEKYNMRHDVYSLGVVLLELGLWLPLLSAKYEAKLGSLATSELMREALMKITEKELVVSMGRRYCNVVTRCLCVEADLIPQGAAQLRYVEDILEVLEDLSAANA